MARPHVYTTDALVLRRGDFGEDSRLVTLLSREYGKKTAIARGAKRTTSKLANHLEPFVYCRLFVAHGRNLDLITQASTIEPFDLIRQDVMATTAACFAAELVDRATERDMDLRELFDLLVAFLRRLDRGGQPEPLLRFFEMRLLSHLGYRPALTQCAACGGEVEPTALRFSPEFGGVQCLSCAVSVEDARAVSPSALNLLRLWQSGAYSTWEARPAPAHVTAEATALVRACMQRAVDREPRSARLLERLRVAEPSTPYAAATPAI